MNKGRSKMDKKRKAPCGVKAVSSGIQKDIFYDRKVSKLNLQLGTNTRGDPVIIFQDWNGEGEDLLTLHIKEAIELKSMIDVLMIDYLDDLKEDKE